MELNLEYDTCKRRPISWSGSKSTDLSRTEGGELLLRDELNYIRLKVVNISDVKVDLHIKCC